MSLLFSFLLYCPDDLIKHLTIRFSCVMDLIKECIASFKEPVIIIKKNCGKRVLNVCVKRRDILIGPRWHIRITQDLILPWELLSGLQETAQIE